MITLATLVLVFALVLISVFLLASSIRWLITGRKNLGFICAGLSTLEKHGQGDCYCPEK